MTWRLLRAKLPLVCMVMLSLVNLLLLPQIRPSDRLDILRSTIRLGWPGSDPSLAQATAPLRVPKRPPPQPPAQRPVLWTAPPIPGRRKHCYPGWGRYLASGPTGAVILVLRQQVLITAKLRGRHSIFLFGVIAASPCCTSYTGRLTEVRPSHRLSAPPELYLLSPQASIPSCQLACVLSRWPWHAASLASALVSTCSYEQWPLCAPATTTPLLIPSTGCSVPTQKLGTCLPGVCAFGPLPQSALSGCRLSIASIYSHWLRFTPGQGPSRHLWLSRRTLHRWPHSWTLTLQLHDHIEGAAWFMSPSRAVRLPSHRASCNAGWRVLHSIGVGAMCRSRCSCRGRGCSRRRG